MRRVRMIIIWILISVILQCGVLFYLNNFYFAENTDVSMQKISIADTMNEKTIHVEIPSDASNVGISFDGVYIVYKENGVYKIADSSTGNIKDLGTSENPILFAKWITGRDMLLNLQVNDGEVVLYSYDAQTGQNRKLVNICEYSSSFTRYDIQASAITGVTYVKVDNVIFRIDINQISAQVIYPVVQFLGNIDTMPTKDRLVYLANQGNVLHLTQPAERIPMNTAKPLNILGIDDNGVIYLGEMENGYVTSIITKNLNNPLDPSKTIALKEPVTNNDISVRQSGKIYVNYNMQNEVEELQSKTITPYNGQFLGFYQYGVSTLKDGKYYKQTFK
ncbi:hypothetical protein ACED96_14735 [Clostridium thermobutyricum]|uniref:Uncharacterized protein n=2 Tax=Clostridium thermobutyricum TaxID=29372 RepID=N9WKX4_9CLOT|nr:hypothetical protein [Clostridium thermobutyricum]ENZ03721.1 hypothetical protein HMPREF1092_00114 [Clostridium thermobutyricum]OPX48396.1 hypothetical protein CLTHE_12190 [Clostridium thermobutyricum DSM 4928]